MTAIVIVKKKYMLISEKNMRRRKKRALKAKPERTFTIDEARAYSKKLIRQWAAGK